MKRTVLIAALLAILAGCTSTSELAKYDRMEGHGYDALRTLQQSTRPSIHGID